MKIVSKLSAGFGGEYAVCVAENHYIVYAKGEVTLQKIRTIFPDRPTYENSSEGWVRV